MWRGLAQLRTGILNFENGKFMSFFGRMDWRTLTWSTDDFMPPEDKKGVKDLGKESSIFWDWKSYVPKESCR